MVSITIDRGDRGIASYRSRRRETKKPETRTLRDGERSFRESYFSENIPTENTTSKSENEQESNISLIRMSMHNCYIY